MTADAETLRRIVQEEMEAERRKQSERRRSQLTTVIVAVVFLAVGVSVGIVIGGRPSEQC